MINKQRLVETFLKLVQIDSPSGDEELVSQELTRRLKVLGGKVEPDSYGNIICHFKGQGESLLLNAHMDTVEPGRGINPSIKKDRIISDGRTILGADPKAGVAIILEALTSLKEDQKSSVPVEVVFTREEESTLGGAMSLDYKKIRSKHGIIFDGDEGVHRIFVSSPWYLSVLIEVTGRASHAAEPEKGLSAIEIGAKIIAQLELGRSDFETTGTVGLVKGGSAVNAVAELMEIKAELRSRDKKKLLKEAKKVEKVVLQLAKQYPEAKIKLKMQEEFQGFKLPPTHPAIQRATAALKAMSLEPQLIDTNGGSDANIFHKHGIEVVVVGTGAANGHTTREYVVIDQMVEAAHFCEKLLQ
ncbi:MAG: M20/M25/M40 family metallo-hydrolase [Candidatus Daviesbacteria bacterium]|nr:M20/M25/M40 family metallo-hydrolase [Candidatus Daviesbacteria bacterium]